MNLINQISFEPSISSSLLEEQTSNRLSKTLNEILVPIIEKCVSNSSFADQNLRIDQLEIDLGAVTFSELNQVLPLRLEKELYSLIDNPANKVSSINPTTQTTNPIRVDNNLHRENTPASTNKNKRRDERNIKPSSEIDRSKELQTNNKSKIKETSSSETDPIKLQPNSISHLEALIHILEKGISPWWVSESQLEDIFSLHLWHRPTFHKLRQQLFNYLEKQHFTPLIRLYHHLLTDSNQTKEIGQSIHLDKQTAWQKELCNAPSYKSEFTTFIQWILSSQTKPTHNQLVSLKTCIAKFHSNIFHTSQDPKPPEQNSSESLLANSKQSAQLDKILLHEKTRTSSNQSANSQVDENQSYQLSNAGLVLLNPFITSLFQRLDFLDLNNSLKPDTRWLAVQTLQYLCRGESRLPEPTLILEKILCGLPTNTLAEFPPITDEIQAECDGLLKSAISHWTILGNTSPDGLRQSFLKRQGVLIKKEDSWQLQVEQQTIDILLNQLPWQLSIIKLPWLDQSIHVTWNS